MVLAPKRIAFTFFSMAALLFLALPILSSDAGTRTVDGAVYDWTGTSTWIAGATNYSQGEFIYQDVVFDDTGSGAVDANNEPVGFIYAGRGVGTIGGGFRYPNNFSRYGSNCADILQLRMTADEENLYILVQLNTLLANDTTVAAVAFGDTVSEAVSWPFDAGISTPGTKHVLTLWGTGGAWDQTSLQDVGGSVAVSVEDNAIEASIPLSLLGDTFQPGTRSFRAYAATGLWDSANNCWMDTVSTRTTTKPGFQNTPGYGNFTQYWKPNLPRLFNVAFRPVEEEGVFRERKQSAALYQKDISQFYADIDLDAPDVTPPIPRGLHVRIYKSSTTIQEPGGIHEGFYESSVPIPDFNIQGSMAKYHFLGPYQPYAVYMPANYDRMQLFLHGAGGSYITQMIMHPGGQADLGDYGEALLVGPLGRGTTGFYVDYSYLDVIEVIRDAMRVYSNISPMQTIDPGRVSATGYSMGGYGSSMLSVLNPDLFNAHVRWAGLTTYGTRNPMDLMDNLRHIPVMTLHGEDDASVNIATQETAEDLLKGLGYEYLFQRYEGYGHGSLYDEDEWSLPAQWLKEAPARNINPAWVTYKTCEAWWRPDISPDLVFDKAYWVSGLRVRDTSLGTKAYGLIDVTTYALSGSNPDVVTISGSAYTPTNHNYYTYTGQNYVWPDTHMPLRNRFEMNLTNLASVTLDPARMGLSIPSVSFTVSSDGPATLTLTGIWPFCKVLMDNRIYHDYTLTAIGLTVDIPEGQHKFKLILPPAHVP